MFSNQYSIVFGPVFLSFLLLSLYQLLSSTFLVVICYISILQSSRNNANIVLKMLKFNSKNTTLKPQTMVYKPSLSIYTNFLDVHFIAQFVAQFGIFKNHTSTYFGEGTQGPRAIHWMHSTRRSWICVERTWGPFSYIRFWKRDKNPFKIHFTASAFKRHNWQTLNLTPRTTLIECPPFYIKMYRVVFDV